MSADIVNLRKIRKARDRAEKEKRAEENRVKFGRTKAEREALATGKAISLRRLDAHRRDGQGDEEENGGGTP